jgi:predicted kinase
VLDASFRGRAQRGAAFELARRRGVPFLFIECVAPPEVSRARLRERARGPSVSDGRLELFDAFVRSYEPVDELPAPAYLRVSTAGEAEDALAQVMDRAGR